jgi:hypothetical protein
MQLVLRLMRLSGHWLIVIEHVLGFQGAHS